MLARDVCYRALRARDARFDGRFYTCVKSTGIYCRPICPARSPKLENCLFVPSAAAAHQLGFRSCLRCRPELAPHVAAWRGTANTVSRALTLIAEGALDTTSVDALGERLGIGARQLRRLFDRHLGATPSAVAQAQRISLAKRLLSDSSLPMADVAAASGFRSIRRLNQVILDTYGRPPRSLRGTLRPDSDAGSITLKLPFAPPYDWHALLGFLAARAIPGVERVHEGRYARTFALGASHGVLEVSAAHEQNHLLAVIHTNELSTLGAVVARLRRLFDLDADSRAIDGCLADCPRLRARVLARPGIRVPGAWDGFELAVRAVLGQQISVAAATTFAGRIAAALGSQLPAEVATSVLAPRLLFPTPRVLATADLRAIGLTGARAQTLTNLALAVDASPRLLSARPTLEASVAELAALPGVGPWTAHYIALRALNEPDALPTGDLGLLRALTIERGRPTARELTQLAEAWRPWRGYAAMRLWMQPAAPDG